MRVPLLSVYLSVSALGLAQLADTGREPRAVGDLLVELTRTDTPSELTDGAGRFAPPPDHYWVVSAVNFRNVGKRVVCAVFSGSLRAEFGLVARTDGLSGRDVRISELLPGEQTQMRFIFSLKRGADPLELTVSTVSYGGECGDALPRSATRNAQFPIRGVASPAKDDLSRNGSTAVRADGTVPARPPKTATDGGIDGGIFRVGGSVSAPTVIFKIDPEYSEEALRERYSGAVMLTVVVDTEGRALDIHIVKSLGRGLDEKAIEAVEKWKFKPGMRGGQAVNVRATIEVNFRPPPQ
jgi:TonB family protein